MTKSAQKAANIANAQPFTGLYEDCLLPGESCEEYKRFAEERRSQLKPVGPAEEFVFNQLVYAGWRIKRVERLKATLDQSAASYARIERRCERSLKEIRSLTKS